MKTMKTEVGFEMKGITPLRTHSAALVDPMDLYAREVKLLQKKRTKTEGDDEQVAFLEARGGMYVEDIDGVKTIVAPTRNIKAMLRDAGKARRLGTAIEDVLQVVETDFTFSGPTDPDERARTPEYRDRRVVSANPGGRTNTKTIRTRPVFHDWKIVGKLVFANGKFNADELYEVMELAGISGCFERFDGYGQFEVSRWEVVS